MTAEGWYHDPFGRHAHRWISDGAPTALVRDDVDGRLVEGSDEPTGAPSGDLVPVEAAAAPVDGSDLLRADAVAAGSTSSADLLRSDDGEAPGPDPTIGIYPAG